MAHNLLNRSILLIGGTLTSTTTPGLSGPGSNCNGKVFYLRFQNWIVTIRSILTNSGLSFLVGEGMSSPS